MVIDSKSFYASVESIYRGLNPLTSLLIVMSQRDASFDDRLLIVQPRMNRYIEMNKKVNDIFRQFVAEEDLHFRRY